MTSWALTASASGLRRLAQHGLGGYGDGMQINDLFVDANGLIWVTDRLTGGLYVLQPEPGLAALMDRARLRAG